MECMHHDRDGIASPPVAPIDIRGERMISGYEWRARAMPVVRLVLMAAAIPALAARPARALDPPEPTPIEGPAAPPEQVLPPEPELPPWSWTWERPAGLFIASVGLELGVLRAGQIGPERDLAGGFQMQVLGAGKRWPLMVGLGGGNLWLAYASEPGPEVRFESDEGVWIPATTVERSLELSHLELMTRFQPLWGWARPYLEGFVGLAILRQSAEVQDRSGNVLAEQVPDRDVGMVYGGTLGVDLGSRHGGFTFTMGVKRLCTHSLDRVVLTNDGDSWSLSDEEQKIAMWSPFMAVSLVF
jgi:hypothetical protein